MGVIYEPGGRAAEYGHLAANFYDGCWGGCDYCYVPAFVHREKNDFHTRISVRKDVLHRLVREAPNYRGTDIRVLLCFTCDAYQPLDDSEHITRDAIKIFKANNIPIQVLTKGGMRAARDFDLYGPEDLFGVTLTLLDEKRSLEYEPHCALPEERIASLQAAKSRGIGTYASLEPVLDPAASLNLIRRTHKIVDHFRIGKLNHRESLSPQGWRRFGIAALQLCRKLKVDYFIKEDLVKHMDGIHFYNTDMRKVKR